MASEYYIVRDGRTKEGPFSSNQLKQLAAAGNLGQSDLVWKEGFSKWVPAGEIKGLFPHQASQARSAHDPFVFDAAANPESEPRPPAASHRSPFNSHAAIFVAIGGGVVLLLFITVIVTLWASGVSSRPKPGQPGVVSADNSEKPGRLRATVTWKFNDVVGTKPDTGSVVLLIPKDLRGKLDTGNLDPLLAKFKVDDRRMDDLTSKGAYLAIVGGDGKATIPGIKAGDYRVVIVSANTKDDLDNINRSKTLLKPYFEADLDVLGVKKVHLASIKISPGEETEYSHDFGLTFY